MEDGEEREEGRNELMSSDMKRERERICGSLFGGISLSDGEKKGTE